MNAGKAIKSAMKRKMITQKKFTELSGEKTQSVISNRLIRGNSMTFTIALEMLNVLDYELVIQPKKRGRRSEDQILITLEDED